MSQPFGEYLDFHPHVHALVADGLFTRQPSTAILGLSLGDMVGS
ncbi:MAG: transposase [Limisphaerales bacterium]